MSDYYNTYLKANEKQFINKIADIAVKKLRLSPPKYITLTEIETAFNETFPAYNSNDHIYEIFDECATNTLTKQFGVIYNQMHFRESGTDEEIKQKIKNSFAYDLKRWFTHYENNKLTNQSVSDNAIQTYVNNRKFQDLTAKLPELKGIFESNLHSYYTLPLTKPEIIYIETIVNTALEKLLNSPKKYINITDIEDSFSRAFPSLHGEIGNAVFHLFEQLTNTILTQKQDIPETKEQKITVKQKLIDELTNLLRKYIDHFNNLTFIPPYQHTDLLIKKYVDNRKLHELESKLPELKGILSDL